MLETHQQHVAVPPYIYGAIHSCLALRPLSHQGRTSHVASGTSQRGVPRGNEHAETYGTFHTEVAWHVACATCDSHATRGLDMLILFKRATCHPGLRCQILMGLSLPNLLLDDVLLHFFHSNNKIYNKMKTFRCMAHDD